MKNSVFTFAILLSFFSLLFSSCDSAVPDPTKKPEQYGGTFKVYMNDKLVKEGSTESVGLMANLVTMDVGNAFGIVLSVVPVEVGESISIDNDEDNGGVIVTGKNIMLSDDSNESYFSVSGTMTRVSKTKITFEGMCTDGNAVASIKLSGVVESEAFKLIKEIGY